MSPEKGPKDEQMSGAPQECRGQSGEDKALGDLTAALQYLKRQQESWRGTVYKA